MARRPASLETWIQRRLRADPPRSKSLIMTIFGDSIAPYSPGLWLTDLISLLQPFGVNERLVRTSGFRLVEEGWLQTERHGRSSRYRLTNSGSQRVQHASKRIYDPPSRSWGGQWTVLLLRSAENGAAERLQLRRELEWEGFGRLAPGMFVHPSADHPAVREVLDRLGMVNCVVLFEASTLHAIAPRSDALLVTESWPLEQVRARYEAFLQSFDALPALLGAGANPESAFVAQTLLIHAFRRAVLHDPRLPGPLLPDDWPGHSAYELCRELYRRTFLPAREFLAQHLEAVNLQARPPREIVARLGGLGPRDRQRSRNRGGA